MSRWLLLPLGLAFTAAAAWLWLAAPPGDAPSAEIDAESRRALERVLERADRRP